MTKLQLTEAALEAAKTHARQLELIAWEAGVPLNDQTREASKKFRDALAALNAFKEEETGKIITKHVYPPIPDRSHDWCAYYDGEEEAGDYGWGKTEEAAICDLRSLRVNYNGGKKAVEKAKATSGFIQTEEYRKKSRPEYSITTSEEYAEEQPTPPAPASCVLGDTITLPRDIEWRIWSTEHRAWWNPARQGYTSSFINAGLFSFEEASQICQDSNCHTLPFGDAPDETMLPALNKEDKP